MKQPIFSYINNEDRGYEKGVENTHHIFPRHLGGTNVDENKIKLYVSLHDAHHRVHGTTLIRAQIETLFKINGPALTNGFVNDVMSVLEETDLDYYYKDGVYRKR